MGYDEKSPSSALVPVEAPVRLSASYGGEIVLHRHTAVPLGF